MNDVDIAVGNRIRMYRKAIGMSQTALADGIGVKFQQVQKYENGSNRVAASRLWAISEVLAIPIVALFEDFLTVPADTSEDTKFLELFHRLPAEQRPEVMDLLRNLANVQQHSDARVGT